MAEPDPSFAAHDVVLRDVTQADLPTLFEHQNDPVANRMAAVAARNRDAFMAHWATILADLAVKAQTVLVGEIGALSTCPVRSLRWLGNAKTRLLAHNVLAINWNLRTDPDKEYNPLLQPDIATWWLAWAADETG